MNYNCCVIFLLFLLDVYISFFLIIWVIGGIFMCLNVKFNVVKWVIVSFNFGWGYFLVEKLFG